MFLLIPLKINIEITLFKILLRKSQYRISLFRIYPTGFSLTFLEKKTKNAFNFLENLQEKVVIYGSKLDGWWHDNSDRKVPIAL